MERDEQQQTTWLVDCRQMPAPYPLLGARHVPRGMLEAKADLEYANREPALADRSVSIIVHCASGARSAMAADVLQEMGFSDVKSMAGGIVAWKEQGLPIEK